MSFPMAEAFTRIFPDLVRLVLPQGVIDIDLVIPPNDIFQRAGEFPNSADVEYPVAPAAIDFYKNGPSFMQRHLPLWLSVHAQRAKARHQNPVR
jgi:hypothetical protein